MRQSPIDLDSSMIAEVHAPIDFRNYFNGHFNKVNLSNGIFTTLISLPIVLLFYSDIISNIFIDLAFERINYQQRNFRWVEHHIPNHHHYGQLNMMYCNASCRENYIFLSFQLFGMSTLIIILNFPEEKCGHGRTHQFEMAHSVESLTLMLTTFGKLNSIGENLVMMQKDLSTPSITLCKHFVYIIKLSFCFNRLSAILSLD